LKDKLFRNSNSLKYNLVFIIVDVQSRLNLNLFALKLSGERQLDRPFWRRLQSRPKRQQ